jgi:hypothetical protein
VRETVALSLGVSARVLYSHSGLCVSCLLQSDTESYSLPIFIVYYGLIFFTYMFDHSSYSKYFLQNSCMTCFVTKEILNVTYNFVHLKLIFWSNVAHKVNSDNNLNL